MKKSLTIRKGRDRLTVMFEILNNAIDGSLKSHIMYDANLSYRQLEEYLDFLQDKKLLKAYEKDGKTLYKTTSKGLKYIENFAKIKALFHKMYLQEDEVAIESEQASSLSNMMSRIGELDARLESLESHLSKFFTKDLSRFRYCPYCGKEIEK